ncbi:MAG: hypothetical protein ACOVP2_09195 [Armatimonadaceae bacterium]
MAQEQPDHSMAAILSQVQDLIDMATYETQTDVASTLAHWTASIVAGEIRDASLTVFATTDPITNDVVDRIAAPTSLRIAVKLADGRVVETQTTLHPPKHPYLVSLRPQG